MLLTPYSLHIRLFEPQAIGDDKHTAEGHSAGGQHGIEQAESRRRNEDNVIKERPEQILLDGAQGLA